MNNWALLTVAILLEVAATTSMKFSAGFTRPGPSVLMFVLYAMSFACLSNALRTIEVGTAYAIWAGAGTALIAAIGVAVFDEGLTPQKLLGVALIIGGVVALKLEGGAH
ncbi:MAG TPA: multidrug efflux SMR transporter [Aromatoleum sp.]|uniref:DMT family transporter n=1 Tax=Aromatoleum sp. TaxID=2307007 RepID=UPI002B486A1F|nr:multidrug efflux SMR transporter [Aromatoleum sp.]HJV27418.1 multidrug efflux SMR transporter [Aromatoleum sp.]